MTWWVVFIILETLPYAATRRFVPAEHRQKYIQHSKGALAFWLANLFAHGIWITAAVQDIVAPSVPPPIALRIVGALLMAGGYALAIAARRVNPFAIPTVMKPDCVITVGVYAYLDHPMYAGLGLVACGTFFLLGQFWALIPTLAYLSLLSHRIQIEDKILSQ